ncbi:Hypothetical predicted protein [Olea europaea subsp. europaea]|uniref:Uncharacterized protein n=1 Tax=Olea europaea subsp. europaea TaxID=158383 RepID=A0A8S0S614_OLEEU|nr:Hypothetical predicted protein [Olea europaea subsp. europaea]
MEVGMAEVEVPKKAEIEEVEGGIGVPEGVTEEVPEGTPKVVVKGDEWVAEDERMPEMTDDDVLFVSEGATETKVAWSITDHNGVFVYHFRLRSLRIVWSSGVRSVPA